VKEDKNERRLILLKRLIAGKKKTLKRANISIQDYKPEVSPI
jgi:hypothetical protein